MHPGGKDAGGERVIGGDKEVISLQTWWMGELKRITQKVMDEETRRQTRAREKAEKQLGEYRTYADVQDAYGCGVISTKKRDRLYDLLDQVKPVNDDLYEMKIEMLSEMYQTAKRIVEDRKHE